MLDNISNIDNYNSLLDETAYTIFSKLHEITIEYISHFDEIINISKDNTCILLKGLHCICNVFYFILLYTKNIELTYHHSKQSILYYVEFIQQIGDDNQGFLQLSSKDAVIFVYKKTIFDINTEIKKKHSLNENENVIVKFMEITIDYLNTFVFFVLEQDIIDKNEIISNISKVLDTVKNNNDGIYFYYKKLNIITTALKKLMTYDVSFHDIINNVILLTKKLKCELDLNEERMIENINSISEIEDFLHNPMKFASL